MRLGLLTIGTPLMLPLDKMIVCVNAPNNRTCWIVKVKTKLKHSVAFNFPKPVLVFLLIGIALYELYTSLNYVWKDDSNNTKYSNNRKWSI